MLNQYERYVIEEANHHMKLAREILEEGLKDPERYFKESRKQYENCVKVIPFLYMMSQKPPEARL